MRAFSFIPLAFLLMLSIVPFSVISPQPIDDGFILAEDGPVLANADGPYYPVLEEFHFNNHTFTHTDNGEYIVQKTSLNLGVEGDHTIWLSINFTLPDYENIFPSYVLIQGKYANPGDSGETLLSEFVDAWDWTSNEWIRLYTNSTEESDTEHTMSESLGSDYVNSARNVSIRYGTNWTLPSGVWEFNGSYIDYCFVYYSTSIWHAVGTAEVFFDVEGWNAYTAIVGFLVMFPKGVIQAWLVFLGLILIPASSVYLVHGRRKEASMNKLFFTLVIFFVGFALLIGGIMP